MESKANGIAMVLIVILLVTIAVPTLTMAGFQHCENSCYRECMAKGIKSDYNCTGDCLNNCLPGGCKHDDCPVPTPSATTNGYIHCENRCYRECMAKGIKSSYNCRGDCLNNCLPGGCKHDDCPVEKSSATTNGYIHCENRCYRECMAKGIKSSYNCRGDCLNNCLPGGCKHDDCPVATSSATTNGYIHCENRCYRECMAKGIKSSYNCRGDCLNNCLPGGCKHDDCPVPTPSTTTNGYIHCENRCYRECMAKGIKSSYNCRGDCLNNCLPGGCKHDDCGK